MEIEGGEGNDNLPTSVKMLREVERMLANSGLQQCVDGRKGNRRLTGE